MKKWGFVSFEYFIICILNLLLPLHGWLVDILANSKRYTSWGAIKDILLLLLAIVWISHVAASRKRFINNKVTIWTLFFSVFIICHILISVVFLSTGFLGLLDFRFHIELLLLYFVASTFDNTVRIKRVFTFFILGGILLSSFVFISACKNGFRVRFSERGVGFTALYTVNTYAIFLAILAVSLESLMIWCNERKFQIIAGFALFVTISALFVTYSRRAWFAFTIGSLLVAHIGWRHHIKVRILWLLSFLFLAIIASLRFTPDYAQRLLQTIPRLASSPYLSWHYRLWQWRDKLENMDWFSMLIGSGLGSVKGYGGPEHTLHNYYLSMLTETGFASLLLYGGMLISGFKLAWRTLNSTQDEVLKAISVTAIASLLIVSTTGFVGDSNSAIPVGSTLWLLVGLTAAIRQLQISSTPAKAR